MRLRVDLNADVGEGGDDGPLIGFVSSVNIAAGFHAGSPETIRATVALSAGTGAAIGAHPSLPDREGFGRRDLAVTPDEAYALVLYQAGAVGAFARAAGRRLAHVKPHGALYNKAAVSPELAAAIAAAVRDTGPDVILYGLPFSELERAARSGGVPFAAEVFADRTVRANGTLTPRGEPGAFVTDPEAAALRAVSMVREGRVRATTGEWVEVRADTICVHGDTPSALAFARSLRAAFKREGIAVAAPDPARGDG